MENRKVDIFIKNLEDLDGVTKELQLSDEWNRSTCPYLDTLLDELLRLSD